jgi:DNA-binding NarL/FixJ family response regulator
MLASEKTSDAMALTSLRADPDSSVVIRVLIVNDHEIVAEGIHQLLEICEDIEVLRVLRDVDAAVDAVASLHPDVVILADSLFDSRGVAMITEMTKNHPETHVVILTAGGANERLACQAFAVGCSGFLGGSHSVDDLLSTIRAAHAGEILITASVLSRLIPRISPASEGASSTLSRREIEVLTVMSEGRSDREIAEQLCVSLNTVRKHTQNIIGKLGVHSKLEAVVMAARTGVIPSL